MAFKKGHKKLENSGIKKGEKQKKTLAWEAIGEYIINEGAARVVEILKNDTDGKFMHDYQALLEYFKPKLARTELTGENGGEVKLRTTIKFSDGSNRE